MMSVAVLSLAVLSVAGYLPGWQLCCTMLGAVSCVDSVVSHVPAALAVGCWHLCVCLCAGDVCKRRVEHSNARSCLDSSYWSGTLHLQLAG